MMDWDKVSAELSRPLDKKYVKPPAQGKFGEYIEGWHAIAEANRIFGHNGWSYRVDGVTVTHKDQRGEKWAVGYLATVTVEIDGVQRQDVGHGQGHSKSLGDAHEGAVKEAVTDALKRALRTFGWPLGLALYDKDKAHVGSNGSSPATAAADGLRQAWIDGILDSLPENATQEQRDTAFANAIIAQFHKMKSHKGLQSTWAKRQDIISEIRKSNPQIAAEIDDHYASCERVFTEPEEGEAA